MSAFTFPADLVGTASLTVDDTNTAATVGSGGLPVFATPMLVALSERAAFEAAQRHLADPWTTVGTLITVEHLAATPRGMKVTAEARLVKFEKRQMEFDISVKDEKELVGRGTHTRVIVDGTRFLAKTESKRSAL